MVPPDDRALTIDACCSEFDVIVSVVDLVTDTTVALRDDGGCGSWHHGNAVSLDHVFGAADTRYAVVVRGWRGAVGSYNITFDCETRSVSERACPGRPIPPTSPPTAAPPPSEVKLSIAYPVAVVDLGTNTDRLFGQFAYEIEVANGMDEFDTVITITGDRDGCVYDGYSNGLALETGVNGSYFGVHTRTVISYRSAYNTPVGSCYRLTDNDPSPQTFTVTAHLKPAGRPWAERFAASAPVTIGSYRGTPPVGTVARQEAPWLNSYLKFQHDLVAVAILMDVADQAISIEVEYVVAWGPVDFIAVMTEPDDPNESVPLAVAIVGRNLAGDDTLGRRTARLSVTITGVNVGAQLTLKVWLCKRPTYGTGLWENRLQTMAPISVYRRGGAGQGSLQADGGTDAARETEPTVDPQRGPSVTLALALAFSVVAALAVVAWRRHTQAERITAVVSLAATDAVTAPTGVVVNVYDAVLVNEAFV